MGKFYIEKETAFAIGEDVENGFLIHAGSTAMAPGSPQVKRNEPVTDELLKHGVLVEHTGFRYRFARDHVFNSRAQAAGVIIDGNANGIQEWRLVETGKTIKQSK